MSFEPSNPTSGFTSPDGWEPHDDAAAIGLALRGGSTPTTPTNPTPTENVVGSWRRAFPGGGDILPAQGAGAAALSNADRAGVLIFKVTNTNNSGAGSFREALTDAWEADQDALKIIVFHVGGNIDLTSVIRLPDHGLALTTEQKQFRNVYVAGQTAPGDGVCVRAYPNTTGTRLVELQYTVEDWVWRGVRFRHGYYENGDSGDQNLMFRESERTVIDGCTFSWAPGRNIQMSNNRVGRSSKIMNITVQGCMFYESFAPHRTAVSGIGTDNEEEQDGILGDLAGVSTGFTFLRNIMASTQRRAPNVGSYGEVLNNIAFNIAEDGGWYGATRIQDCVGNVWIDGPLTKVDYIPVSIIAYQLFDAPYEVYRKMGGPSYYVAENVWLARPGTGDPDHLTDISLDNWSNSVGIDNRGDSDQGVVGGFRTAMKTDVDDAVTAGTEGFTGLLEFKRTKRMWEIVPGDRAYGICATPPAPVFPATVLSPYDIIEPVKANAGACWRVNERGEWVQDRRDEADARIVSEIESGSPLTSQLVAHLSATKAEVDARYPYPLLSAGSAPTDSNGDGIPDAFYAKWGYDPAASGLAGIIASDGYCLAEHYVNGTSPVDSSIQIAP